MRKQEDIGSNLLLGLQILDKSNIVFNYTYFEMAIAFPGYDAFELKKNLRTNTIRWILLRTYFVDVDWNSVVSIFAILWQIY